MAPSWLQIIEKCKNLGSLRRIGDPVSKNYKTPSVSWQPDSWESQRSRKGKTFHACWRYFFVLHRCRHWCRPCDSWKSCEMNWSCFFQHNRRKWIDLASSCGQLSSESPTASIPIVIMSWFIPTMWIHRPRIHQWKWIYLLGKKMPYSCPPAPKKTT